MPIIEENCEEGFEEEQQKRNAIKARNKREFLKRMFIEKNKRAFFERYGQTIEEYHREHLQ